MNKIMKTNKLKYLAAFAVALLPITNIGAAVLVGVGLNGGGTSVIDDTASPNGIYWNGTTSTTSPSIANMFHAQTGLTSGISFSTINSGGFLRTQDGLPNAATDYDGIRYPTFVLNTAIADNFSGRDGLMVFRFVIPANLIAQNEFKINSVLGSNNSTGSFEYNVGGTWGGSGNRTFTGGTTVSSAGSTTVHTYVTLSNIQAVYDSVTETYTLDVQYGYTGVADGGVVALRGITVEAIPEPSTYALIFGLGALGFVLIRVRRKRL